MAPGHQWPAQVSINQSEHSVNVYNQLEPPVCDINPILDDGGTRKCKIEHLTPMHKYRFRVVAVNKIGPSDPGEMKGDDILMKDPWGKCSPQFS